MTERFPPSSEEPAAVRETRRVYRVSEITRAIKAALENEFGMVWIEGEVSNLRKPPSGHQIGRAHV